MAEKKTVTYNALYPISLAGQYILLILHKNDLMTHCLDFINVVFSVIPRTGDKKIHALPLANHPHLLCDDFFIFSKITHSAFALFFKLAYFLDSLNKGRADLADMLHLFNIAKTA